MKTREEIEEKLDVLNAIITHLELFMNGLANDELRNVYSLYHKRLLLERGILEWVLVSPF